MSRSAVQWAGAGLAAMLALSPQTAEAGIHFWTRTGPSGVDLPASAVDPRAEQLRFVGADPGLPGGGAAKDLVFPLGISAAVDLLAPDTVYAGFFDLGLFRSTDRGQSWHPFGAGLPAGTVRVLEFFFGGSAGRLFAAVDFQGLYLSSDRGATWQRVLAPGPGGVVTCLSRSRFSDPDVLYAGSEIHGVFTSTDGGLSWAPASQGLPIGIDVMSLLVDPVDSAVVYAGTRERGVWRSLDGGGSWEAFNLGGLENATVLALEYVLSFSPGILAGTVGQGLYRWTDFDGRWSRPEPALGDLTTIADIVPHPVRDRTYFLSRLGQGVWVSDDGGGRSWRLFKDGELDTAWALAAGQGFNTVRLYAAGEGGAFELEATEAVPELYQNRRFEVSAAFRLADGRAWAADPFRFSERSGYFTFLRRENVEVVAKILDGRPVNGSFWLFTASLSNIEYAVEVRDLSTGRLFTVYNPAGQLASFAGFDRFPDAQAASPPSTPPDLGSWAEGEEGEEAGAGRAVGCGTAPGASPPPLCLMGRYTVRASWNDLRHQRSGVGTAVPLTADSGYFWFFGPASLEVVVKMVDGALVNGRIWFFYGAMSDVEYELVVTDTVTGQVRTYRNPHGRLASRADTRAF